MKFKASFVWLIILCVCMSTPVLAQTDVERLMEEQTKEDEVKATWPTTATFESTHLIYGHSVETTKAGNLDFRLSHRFARINQGIYDWFGMDYASMRFGFDYGITDRLMVGVGRSSWDKEFDVSAAYKVLQQSSGARNMPVSLTVFGEWMIKTLKDPTGETDFSDKLSTAFQVLVARKFSKRISAQIVPTWIYYANPPQEGDPNNIFSIGMGGRIKVAKRISLNVEYYPLFSDDKPAGTVSPLSVGVDIETGGHVFQLFVGNAVGTNERLFITQTTDLWEKGQLHLGFNILRVFTLKPQRTKQITSQAY